MKKFKYPIVVKLLSILLGTFLMAVSINALMIPNKILSGGVSGVSILLHIMLGFNTSLSILFINIPLFLLAAYYLNKRFVLFSLIGLFSLTLLIDLTKGIPTFTGDLLVVTILSGILTGVGSGIIFKFNGSTGGSDIIAKILYKYRGYNISTVLLSINFTVICLSAIFFGLPIATYTLISMFITSQISKIVIDGAHNKRAIFIITNEYNAISQAILHQLHRGVTTIKVTGTYTHEEKRMLYCTIGVREAAQLKLIVKELDPLAFMTITDTSQVFGRGFIDIKSED